MKKYVFILFATLLHVYFSVAQVYKFGKVSKQELKEQKDPQHPGAHATYLYKEQKSSILFDKNSFVLKTQFYFRIKIYDKDGLAYATREIKAYKDGNLKEKIIQIKAQTYNLENGKIKITKLPSSQIYKEETGPHLYKKKFSLPAVKPGSVIEIKYQINSPFFHLIPELVFQDYIPVRKAKGYVSYPVYFKYRYMNHGNFKVVHRKISREVIKSAGSASSGTIEYKEIRHYFDASNLPPLKKEPYAGNMDNYLTKITFEITAFEIPRKPLILFADTWKSVSHTIYKNENFGKQISSQKYLKDDAMLAVQGKETVAEKAKALLDFARNKIKWNGYYGKTTDRGVKYAYREGTGNSAEVNLNLVNMLKAVGLEAYPVLISTVDHGIPIIPTIRGFNSVIVAVKDNDKWILLDATDENSEPGFLPLRDLNFDGRLIKSENESEWVRLYPDKHSTRISRINSQLDAEGGLKGISTTEYTGYYAMDFNESFGDLDENNRKKKLDEKYSDMDVINARIKSGSGKLKATETIQFESDHFADSAGDEIYLTPLLFRTMESAVFTSPERNFPVFFQYPMIEADVVSVKIPAGYQVSSLPESENLLLGDLGSYSIIYEVKGPFVITKSVLKINEPVVAPDSYKKLKDFFDHIYEKQQEKIVLKKK